ncbi:sce7726 family protein [Aminipila luticellarii]|uniref:Sce7726 family protein n=1 Tax=Aminipila luticellarii TaxID=2507160 RepID=A0A410PSK4_9FIRM|nr:sce7726 family protein [Aminipila luticellarii]QAT41971.1 hypothetical protein EQM06_01305 [Aminipila luticellarii]
MSKEVNREQLSLDCKFKLAQSLYSAYSTLQSTSELEHMLSEIPNTDSTFNYKNPRALINSIILQNYPNEISVKSNFINEVLFKSNNQVTIFELILGKSRADLCKVNGASVAYEIKTDLDNLLRLEKQLTDYLNVFENVFVICSVNKLPEIEKTILEECGIYIYSISQTGKYKFKKYRPALSSKTLNSEKQLKILRKKELYDYFKLNTYCSRESMEQYILQHYSNKKINLIFKTIMKDRYREQWEFLRNNKDNIYEIDYQWFFKNAINPSLIYG